MTSIAYPERHDATSPGIARPKSRKGGTFKIETGKGGFDPLKFVLSSAGLFARSQSTRTATLDR
jgi:hypothetical protein